MPRHHPLPGNQDSDDPRYQPRKPDLLLAKLAQFAILVNSFPAELRGVFNAPVRSSKEALREIDERIGAGVLL
jgi:hypothetical protein